MRRSALALLIATMLAACSESQPPAETAQKTPPAAPAADAGGKKGWGWLFGRRGGGKPRYILVERVQDALVGS